MPAFSPTASAGSGSGGSSAFSPTAPAGIGGGGWSPFSQTAPIATVSTAVVSSSYPTSYNYITANGYQLPGRLLSLLGAGVSAGPFGDYGPYTPLDFPLLHELRPGERLENLQGGVISRSVLPYLVGGLILYLLLKK